MAGNFAVIEENNLNDGVISNELLVSRTSGTAAYETGDFNLKFNDIIYSARSNIAATVASIAPYQDSVSEQIIDTVDLSPPSTFFGLVFQRVPSITYPNVILDNISETVINPTELYDSETANNQDFLDFEEVRNQEIRYNYLAGSQFAAGDHIRNKKIYFNNSSLRGVDDQRSYDAANLIRKNARFIAEEAVGIMKDFYPAFVVQSVGGDRDCEDDIVDILNVVAYQLEYDGNSEVWDAAATYVQGNSVYHLDGAVNQTVYAFNQARDLAIKAIRNIAHTALWTNRTQYIDNQITQEFAVVDNSHADARDLILANKWFIAHEALHHAKTVNPSLTVPGGDNNCLSDIVDMLEAMTYNLAHGGNNFVYDATRKYMVGAHVAGYEDDTVTAFNKARDLAIEVMRNNGIVKQGSHGWVQVTDNTITADTTSPVCIAVASSITTLMGIATGALGTTASPGTLANFEATYTRTIPTTALDGYANGCVNQVSAITNFMKIITDTLQDPTAANPATYQWAIGNVPRIEPAYAFQDGETLRCTKHAYKDKSSGGFFAFGDVITAITSGATYDVIGSNAGNKWIYSKDITGTLQADEYITNSKLTRSNVTQDALTYASGSGSLKFSGTSSYVSYPTSNRVTFGTGDYTLEAWIRPTSLTGTQTIFDFRSSAADSQLTLLMQGNSLRLAIAGSDVIIGTAALNQNANTWYHIAVSRATNVTKLFVGGQQVGSDYTDANDYSVDKVVKVGAAWNNASPFGGWMENVIIRKGIASHFSTFTPPLYSHQTMITSPSHLTVKHRLQWRLTQSMLRM